MGLRRGIGRVPSIEGGSLPHRGKRRSGSAPESEAGSGDEPLHHRGRPRFPGVRRTMGAWGRPEHPSTGRARDARALVDRVDRVREDRRHRLRGCQSGASAGSGMESVTTSWRIGDCRSAPPRSPTAPRARRRRRRARAVREARRAASISVPPVATSSSTMIASLPRDVADQVHGERAVVVAVRRLSTIAIGRPSRLA